MRGGDFFGRRLSDRNGLGAADDVKSSNRIRLEVTTVFVLLSEGVFGSQVYNSRKHCGSGRSARLIPLTQVDGSRVFLSPGAPEATNSTGHTFLGWAHLDALKEVQASQFKLYNEPLGHDYRDCGVIRGKACPFSLEKGAVAAAGRIDRRRLAQ